MAWEDEFRHKPATPEEETEFFWLVCYMVVSLGLVVGMIKGFTWLFG